MKAWLEALGVLFFVVLVSVGLGFAVGHGGLLVGGLPLPCVAAGLALAVNLAAWIPASVLRTERFYDLTGTLTYVAIMALALATAGADLTWRGALACGAVIVWAVRLGAFLVLRIRKDGKDGRFDTLKTTPARFLVPWSLQALWCAVCSVGVVGLVAQGGGGDAVRLTDVAGFGMWVTGFGLEVVADQQKWVHRARGERGFIHTGLWAWSQHPNYFGEILLWSGLFVVGAGVYVGPQWLAVASPVLIAVLLTRVSGIPMVDARAEARYGEDLSWRVYRSRTSLLIPRPPDH